MIYWMCDMEDTEILDLVEKGPYEQLHIKLSVEDILRYREPTSLTQTHREEQKYL